MSGTQSSFIAPRLAIGLLLVSVFSLLVFLVLSAYAPDLRNESSDSGNVLSKSAVGFAGMRFLAQAEGMPTYVWRNPKSCSICGLVVLMPQLSTNPSKLAHLVRPGPRLIILPKWFAVGHPGHPGWVMKLDAYPPLAIKNIINAITKSAKLAQTNGVKSILLRAEYSRFAPSIPASRISVDTLQTISGPDLDPDIVDEHGNAILVRVRATQIYILSDPDFFNNQGLHDEAVACLAMGLIDSLRAGKSTIAFDATLNGFTRSPDMLRALFSPPLLGATLCAILAAAFIAFHALSRFGAPVRPERVFAFGKRALADNTAAVIRLMRREPRMAPRYAQAMLHRVAAHNGIAREQLSESGWIEALETRNRMTLRFADLKAQAAHVRDTHGLIQVAERLYRWRRGLLNEHR